MTEDPEMWWIVDGKDPINLRIETPDGTAYVDWRAVRKLILAIATKWGQHKGIYGRPLLEHRKRLEETLDALLDQQ